jgi:hypothetical protein
MSSKRTERGRLRKGDFSGRVPNEPGPAIPLAAARDAIKRQAYARLVLRAFADADHADRRDALERRADVERRSRERL